MREDDLSTKQESFSNSEDDSLSEKQRILLERYRDGECSWLSSFFARRLIKNNTEAKQYLELLNTGGELLLQSLNEREPLFSESLSDKDLWAKIEQRIEQEERANIFLGAREPAVERKNSIFDRLYDALGLGELVTGRQLVGGGLGLAACSVLLFFGVIPSDFGTTADTQREVASSGQATSSGRDVPFRGADGSSGIELVASQSSGQVAPVPVELVSSRVGRSARFNGMRQDQFPAGGEFLNDGLPLNNQTFDRYAFERYLQAQAQRDRAITAGLGSGRTFVARNRGNNVEVDWMRSDGRVRILNGPQANAPIIFVKPRKPLARMRNVGRVPNNGIPNSGGIVLRDGAIPSATFASR